VVAAEGLLALGEGVEAARGKLLELDKAASGESESEGGYIFSPEPVSELDEGGNEGDCGGGTDGDGPSSAESSDAISDWAAAAHMDFLVSGTGNS